MIRTEEEFFSRNTPRDFPLPETRLPFAKTRTVTINGVTIVIGLKKSGTGRLTMTRDGEESKLYFNGTDWYELENELRILLRILREGGVQANRSMSEIHRVWE